MRRRLLVLFVLPLLVWSLATTIGGGTVTPIPAAQARVELGDGYWMAAQDGGMFTFGGASFLGSLGDRTLNRPIVGMVSHPFLEGYWLVASDGGIFSFGSSGFFGSTGNLTLNSPIVGMAAHPHGLGYWLVAADGGIFSFGDAKFHGSTGNIRLNRPIVGMAPTPSGNGYWLVATDGGVFSFGDAVFHGSEGHRPLNRPVVGIEPTRSGNGYYMVASDGGIFTHGDAVFLGSRGGERLNAPIVGMDLNPDGDGYQFVATDGGIFNYGPGSKFFGSLGDRRLNKPVLGMAVRPRLAIVADAFQNTAGQTSEWTETAGDWRLELTRTSGEIPAGARIYGVEGLDVDQLGTMGFTVDSGACTSSLQFALYYDTNGDGAGDGSRFLTCAPPGTGAKTFDPVAAGAPAKAVVTALDIWWTGTGTVQVDDIKAAGITATDFRPARLDV